MEEKEYSVSEAVRLVGVESHVLRYWEEELRVKIRRTSQGHRVYSRQDIDLFRRVKELKDQGIQLRAIRVLLSCMESEGENREAEGQAEEKRALVDQVLELERRAGRAEPDTVKIRKIAEPDTTLHERKNPGEGSVEKQTAEEESQEEKTAKKESAEVKISAEIPEEERTVEERTVENEPEDFDDDDPTARGDAEPETAYEIIVDEKKENLRQFEGILRRLIAEVVEEQNEKLEQALTDAIREETADLYLLCQDALREAAAGRASEEERGIRGMLKRYFRRR